MPGKKRQDQLKRPHTATMAPSLLVPSVLVAAAVAPVLYHLLRRLTAARWPAGCRLAVATCPFFYGHVILVVVIFIKIFKAGGQNNLMGFATDDLLADESLGMSRTEFASLSSLSTLLGATIQPYLGILTDRLGARMVLPIFLMLLAVGLAVLGSITTALGPLRFVVAGCAMTVVRSLAIGGLEQAPATIVAQWYVKKRGRAVAISNFAMTFGQLIVYSQAYQWSVATWHWRATQLVQAAVLVALAAPAALLLRRSPESCGCIPDFPNPRNKTYRQLAAEDEVEEAEPESTLPDSKQCSIYGRDEQQEKEDEWFMTLGEAVHTRSLWLLCMSALMWGVLGSGFDLHMVSIIGENAPAGMGTIDIATYYAMPQALASCSVGTHTRTQLNGSIFRCCVLSLQQLSAAALLQARILVLTYSYVVLRPTQDLYQAG